MKIKLFFFLFLLPFFNFSFVFAQKSASLFLSPASGTYQVGQAFSISLNLKSEQEAVNAAEATLKFDPSFLRVRSVSDVGSVFTLWPEKPTFSNSAGTIHFVGGSPNPYRGSSGRIITITFEGLKEGTTAVTFTSGLILAGEGNDVTDKLLGGNYTLVPGTTPPPTTPSSRLPPLPKISSPTHPDQEKWYSNNSPKFEWELPNDVLEVKLAYGRNSNLVPLVSYEPPISSKQLENMEEGIWYFAVQFRNSEGWGPIGRFKFQIDKTPPKEFTLSVDQGGDLLNRQPIFRFETSDELSGLDYYEIILNDNSFAKVKPEELKEGKWQPKDSLESGNYSAQVKAFDRAGNFTLSKNETERALTAVSFAIERFPFEISPLPKQIEEGKKLIIEGKTLTKAKVVFYFQKEGECVLQKETIAGDDGRFQFEKSFSLGKYLLWFQAEDKEGRARFSSEQYPLEVVKNKTTFYLSLLLTLLILLGLLIIFYLLRKVLKEREKARLEEEKKRKEIKLRAYLLLKEKIENQIQNLEEKIDLSRSEIRILESLKKAVKEAEEILKEEEK